jgi:hypothetical protein
VVETDTGGRFSSAVDQADRGVLHDPSRIAVGIAVAALLGVLLLLIVAKPRRQPMGEGGTLKGVHVRHHVPPTTPLGQQQNADGRGRDGGQQGLSPEDDSDLRDPPEDYSQSHDELVEALRREVTELQRINEAFRQRSARTSDQHEQ